MVQRPEPVARVWTLILRRMDGRGVACLTAELRAGVRGPARGLHSKDPGQGWRSLPVAEAPRMVQVGIYFLCRGNRICCWKNTEHERMRGINLGCELWSEQFGWEKRGALS